MDIILGAVVEVFLFFVGLPLLGVAILVALVMWQVHVKKWKVGGVGDAAERNRKEKLWATAFIALAEKPSATIACPECGSESLRMADAPYPRESGRADRYVTCSICRALRVPPAA